MANTYISLQFSSISGSVDTKEVKISNDDSSVGFLEEKITAASSKILVTVLNPGGAEELQINVDETQVNHDNLQNYDIAQHRIINDAGTSATELWSASKITAALAEQDDASEITFTPVDATDWSIAPSFVKGGLDELADRTKTVETALVNHITDAVDAHDASSISNVASGNLAATDVQGALNELQTDVDTRALDSALTAHINDVADAHDASAISYNNATSGLSAVETQSAIDELSSEKLDTANFSSSFDTDLATKTTDDLTEGTNLYFTNTRANVSSGDIGESSDSLLQSQTDTVVTGFSFSNVNIRSFSAHVSVTIDATTDLYEEFEIKGIQLNSGWEISVSSVGQDSLISFDIDTLGRVTYTSPTYAGFTSGTVRFRAIVTSN